MTGLRQKGRVLWLAATLFLTMVLLAWGFLLPPSIVIRWQTETEVDTVAFNLLRAEVGNDDFQLVNPRPIPARGEPVQGAVYAYTDTAVQAGHTYTYRLQEITAQGELTTYPWQTTAQAQRSRGEQSAALLALLILWGGWLWAYRQTRNSAHPEAT